MIEITRVRELVKSKGWSLREFFRRLDMDQSNMKMWEQSSKIPDKHLPRIAAILGTTEAYLRGETGDPRLDDSPIDTSDLSWAMYEGSKDLTDDDKREMLAIIELKKKLRDKK